MAKVHTAHHLAEKFGTIAHKVLAPTSENPRLLSRIVLGFPAVMAEVLYCIRFEMATSIEDILARRIGLQLFSWRDAMTAGPVVARCLADELGWSQSQMHGVMDQYNHKINRFLEAAGLSDPDSELKASWSYGFSEVKKV
jgi:glycerol-3-phosphate dehydrogenase